jgi:hypothetical protein
MLPNCVVPKNRDWVAIYDETILLFNIVYKQIFIGRNSYSRTITTMHTKTLEKCLGIMLYRLPPYATHSNMISQIFLVTPDTSTKT